MKGQMLVFEQVLLFFIGVVILISCYALFSSYEKQFLTSTTNDQLESVKDYVATTILEMCKQGVSNSSSVLRIPKTINGKYYTISLNPSSVVNSGLTVRLTGTGEYKYSSLSGFCEERDFSGSVDSTKERVVIYKNGDSIIIK
jgi:hypothetical protein